MNVRKSNGFSDYFSITRFTYEKNNRFYNFDQKNFMMTTSLLSHLLEASSQKSAAQPDDVGSPMPVGCGALRPTTPIQISGLAGPPSRRIPQRSQFPTPHNQTDRITGPIYSALSGGSGPHQDKLRVYGTESGNELVFKCSNGRFCCIVLVHVWGGVWKSIPLYSSSRWKGVQASLPSCIQAILSPLAIRC